MNVIRSPQKRTEMTRDEQKLKHLHGTFYEWKNKPKYLSRRKDVHIKKFYSLS